MVQGMEQVERMQCSTPIELLNKKQTSRDTRLQSLENKMCRGDMERFESNMDAIRHRVVELEKGSLHQEGETTQHRDQHNHDISELQRRLFQSEQKNVVGPSPPSFHPNPVPAPSPPISLPREHVDGMPMGDIHGVYARLSVIQEDVHCASEVTQTMATVQATQMSKHQAIVAQIGECVSKTEYASMVHQLQATIKVCVSFWQFEEQREVCQSLDHRL